MFVHQLLDSPLNHLLLVAENQQLVYAGFGSDGNWLRQHARKKFNSSAGTIDAGPAFLQRMRGVEISIPVKLSGSEFQQKVWAAIATIGWGQTRTYQQLAQLIGQPKAFQAVAQACGANPLPIIIPCHRVTAKTGLGGFKWGQLYKQALLTLEASPPP